MSSHWRRYCEKHGLVNSVARGSWKKRAAFGYSAQGNSGNSWPKKLMQQVQTAGSPGIGSFGCSATRLIVDADSNIESSAARMLVNYGGRPPMN